jgi:hypothetical protein
MWLLELAILCQKLIHISQFIPLACVNATEVASPAAWLLPCCPDPARQNARLGLNAGPQAELKHYAPGQIVALSDPELQSPHSEAPRRWQLSGIIRQPGLPAGPLCFRYWVGPVLFFSHF